MGWLRSAYFDSITTGTNPATRREHAFQAPLLKNMLSLRNITHSEIQGILTITAEYDTTLPLGREKIS